MKRVNEKALLLRFQTGLADREEVMIYIWDKFSKGIFYYISRFYPQDEMKSEDIFQDVMLKIYRSIDTCNPLYSLSTWLYTVTRNQCIDSMRGREEEYALPGDVVFISGRGDSAEESFFMDELRSEIDSAFKSLELREQEVVYLKFYEGRSFRQIAEITGINHSTVKQVYHRAERILYDRLKDYEKD
jgi:RNA polymerase sigma-70 factor (ECF subfamily)